MTVGEDTPRDLRTVDAKEFKRLCRELLEKLSYRVLEDWVDRPRSSSMPPDFLVSGPEGVTAVLCSPYQKRAIGVSVVKRLEQCVTAHGAEAGMLITTGRFSAQAVEQAELVSSLGTQLQLIDRGGLAQMAAQAGMELTDDGEPLVFMYEVSNAARVKEVLGSYLDGLYQSSPERPSSLLEVVSREVFLRPSLKITYDVEAAVRGRGRDGVLDRVSVRGDTLFLDGQGAARLGSDRTAFFAKLETVPYSAVKLRELHPHWSQFDLDAKSITAKAKDAVVTHHSRSGHWWGNRGNLYYGTWQPSKRNVILEDVTPVYLPEDQARIRILKTVYELEFLEHPSGSIEVMGGTLVRCAVCGESAHRHALLCNICGKVVHRKKHGYVCKSCRMTLCKSCARFKKGILFKASLCPDCYGK